MLKMTGWQRQSQNQSRKLRREVSTDSPHLPFTLPSSRTPVVPSKLRHPVFRLWSHPFHNEVSDGPRKGWAEAFIRERCLLTPLSSDDSVTQRLLGAWALLCDAGRRGSPTLGRLFHFLRLLTPGLHVRLVQWEAGQQDTPTRREAWVTVA